MASPVELAEAIAEALGLSAQTVRHHLRNRVARDCRTDVLLRDQPRYNGLPCRGGECHPCTKQKREHDEDGRVDQLEPDQESRSLPRRRSGRFANRSESGAYLRCRQCPCGQREQEHGKAARDLNHGDTERIGSQARHEPSGRRVVHPGADIGDDGRHPDHRERGMTKRDPRRWASSAVAGFCLLSGSVMLSCFALSESTCRPSTLRNFRSEAFNEMSMNTLTDRCRVVG